MTVFGSQWLANAGGAGYQIGQSIRFNDDDSAYLASDSGFGTPTNADVGTISMWFKRGNLSVSNKRLFTHGSGGSVQLQAYLTSSDTLVVGNGTEVTTTQVFRDPQAWYHLVVRVDTSQGTDTNRVRHYLNGSQITDFSASSYPSQNADVFTSTGWRIGSWSNSTTHTFDGYMAEVVYCDGQSLAPTSFGETDDNGVWIPINPSSNTFGSNGFYITGAAASDLGEDFSGNNNDFSSSGLAAADQVTDSPTNNMPTLNPLSSGTGTLSDGNLQYVGVSGNWSNSRLNLLVPDTGKWAIRCKTTTSYDQMLIGLCAPDSASPYTDIDVNGVAQIRYNARDGNFVTRVGGSLVNDTGPATTSAQTFIQLLFDMDNGKMGIAADGATSGTFADISTYSALDLNGDLSAARQPFVQAFAGTDSGAGVIIDAGQSGWTTTVTGFKNLILANLDTPTIKDGSAYFQPKIYTGSTSAQDITFSGNSDLPPDWLWFKARSASDHFVFDKLRGVLKTISTNDRNAEVSSTGSMTAFGTNGFSLGDGGSDNDINGVDGTNYVVWGWAANGSGSSNEDGSINTTATSANTTAGFSINTYTGTGSAGATVGHGLGVKPSVVLIKCFGVGSTHWIINDWSGDYSNKLKLNETEAASSSSGFVTAASSTTFTLGTDTDVNGSIRTYVAYCFAEIPGYSSISSYVGNGSADGPMIFTGMAPAFIIVKRAVGGTGNWDMFDRQRDPINPADAVLDADSSGAEASYSTIDIDFLSNGFKVRGTQSNINASGSTYIYMAFAENPFGGDGVAPATAR